MNLESYYLAQDISGLENGNPWTKNTKLNVLPVFNNTAYFDSSILPQDVEYARRRMTYDAEQAANALDMKVTNEKVEGNIQSVSGINGNDDYQVTVTMANGEIVVKFNSTVITFNEGVKLPEKYKFTAMKTSKKDAESVADYLAKRFSKLLSLSAPFSSIKSHKALCAGYTNDGNIQMDYGVFDASGNITNQILNFNFYKTHFVPDNVGNLKIINIDNGLLCYDNTGDYPIITSDEAFRLLLNGNYFTSVSEKMPGEKYVRKVELLYATGDTVKTFMPVYCYWVELPDKNQANGFKAYGAYYVPAVEQKYITNMPLWDGGTD